MRTLPFPLPGKRPFPLIAAALDTGESQLKQSPPLEAFRPRRSSLLLLARAVALYPDDSVTVRSLKLGVIIKESHAGNRAAALLSLMAPKRPFHTPHPHPHPQLKSDISDRWCEVT
ncbi:uncharacterized protein LAJ45_02696 [Morchella importuna]|uniref:uncharacterized protein n=1 Tax=Morchella importuna TaxID=1174673 RepID=UPI001E8EC0B0|nr:uncharacterized protein LAJ45_02696 [Morchella importuna]KAH8153109.1 hypothetical protein LAJ45_02696 [Morchella importuna]